MTRVLIVEDHELMLDLLMFGLTRMGLEVRAAGDLTPQAVLATAGRFQPDVVLLDLYLGAGVTSLDMVPHLADAGARVLVVTAGTSDRALLAECLEKGAAGLFYKAQPFAELVDRINDAAVGRTVIEPAAREALMEALRDQRTGRRSHAPAFARLSTREREVLAELMRGRGAEEIAHDEYVSLATVRTHIRSILRKLGVNSQLAAVVLAQQSGWSPDGA